jgi:tripartite-type tricarboxylate transporter receptor subunit TctC
MAVVLAAVWSDARAEPYPTHPITLICPLAAGSTTDIIARVIAGELTRSLGQSVIVDDRPGAGGTIAMRQVAKAPPDGYTIVFGTNSTLAINIGLYAKPGYDPVKDFAPILNIATSSNVLIVNPRGGIGSVAALIARAKAEPGKLTFSSGGNGTTHHLSAALLNKLAGLETIHVPYKGAPEGINAVISGEVTFGFFNTPNIVGLAREGTVQGLAVTSTMRSPLLPDLPTMVEAGVPGYETTVSFGLLAPAGTPEPIVARLHDDVVKILADTGLRAKLTEQGYDLLPPTPPSGFADQIKADIAKWVPIVHASGAVVD